MKVRRIVKSVAELQEGQRVFVEGWGEETFQRAFYAKIEGGWCINGYMVKGDIEAEFEVHQVTTEYREPGVWAASIDGVEVDLGPTRSVAAFKAASWSQLRPLSFESDLKPIRITTTLMRNNTVVTAIDGRHYTIPEKMMKEQIEALGLQVAKEAHVYLYNMDSIDSILVTDETIVTVSTWHGHVREFDKRDDVTWSNVEGLRSLIREWVYSTLPMQCVIDVKESGVFVEAVAMSHGPFTLETYQCEMKKRYPNRTFDWYVQEYLLLSQGDGEPWVVIRGTYSDCTIASKDVDNRYHKQIIQWRVSPINKKLCSS